MIVRAKTKRRVVLLLTGVVLVVAALAATYLVLKQQRYQRDLAGRAEGMAALQNGDYETAIDRLAAFIHRYKEDGEAIQSLIEAQKRVDRPDVRNLLVCVQLYRRLIDLWPDRQDVKRELVLLYSKLGYNAEILELSNGLLASNGDDVPVLLARAKSQAALRESEKALQDSERAIKLEPLNVEAQALTLELWQELDGKSSDKTGQPFKTRAMILPHALKLLEAHPGDGRALLLAGFACRVLGTLSAQETQQLTALINSKYAEAGKKYPDLNLAKLNAPTAAVFFVREAAAHPVAGDLGYALLLVNQLDRLGMPVAAAEVLERALQDQPEPRLRRSLHERLYEIGRYADLEKRLANVPFKPGAVDSEMLSLRAIALVRLGRTEEAAAIAEKLAAVPNDRVAHAWSVILKQAVLARGSSLEVIKATREALEVPAQKNNPYLRYHLAEAYAQVGERDLAIDTYRQVLERAPRWHLPMIQLSRLYMEARETQAARAAAWTASQLSKSTGAYINLIAVWAATMTRQELLSNPDLPKMLAEVQSKIPGEETTLPLHVLLLAKTGKQAEAEKAVAQVLGSGQKPNEAVLLQLASICREAGLGQEQACYALAEKLYGVTPNQAQSRAAGLLAAGQKQQAARVLEEAMAKAPAAQSVEWRVAWARFLEESEDPRAAEAWKALGDDPATKDNLTVQRTVLGARSAQADRELMARTIERIRVLSPERAVGWRLAQARLLVRPGAPRADLEQAAKLLDDVVATAPNHPEPRRFLALIHEQLGNRTQAAEHMTAALRLEPDSDAMRLDLARIYQGQAETVRAREQIDRIRVDELTAAERRQLATLLAQQGETARAAELLEKAGADAASPADALLLAGLYQRRDEPAKAEALYRELLKAPTAQVIAAAADFFAATGRPQEAQQALAKLDGLTLEKGLKELVLAEYAARHGTGEEAMKRYEAAAKAAPANAGAWRALVTLQVRAGQIDKAMTTADEALRALPGDRGLEEFRQNAKTIKTVAADASYVPLIVSLLQPGADQAVAVQALRAGAEAVALRQPPMALIGKLRPLADRAPGMEALQILLIEQYTRAGQLDDAASVAQRAAKASPASAEIAQLAARVLAGTNEYTQALVAAEQWRKLTLAKPMAADLFIAAMQMRLNNLPRAEEQIRRYLEAAKADPDGHYEVLMTQARILMKQGRLAEADALIWPNVSRSAQWRRGWFELVMMISGSPRTAATWLGRAEPLVPESALDEQVLLAQMWHELGRQANDKQYTDKAKAILSAQLSKAARPAPLLFTRAVLEEHDNNLAEAEKLYRAALEKQPDFPAAQNNLAMLILTRGGDVAEATALASKAVAALPQAAAFYDTLAAAQAKAKDYSAAIATLIKAVQLEPREPAWLINLAAIHDQAGQKEELQRVLRQVDLLVKNRQLLPAYQQKLDALREKAGQRATAGGGPQ